MAQSKQKRKPRRRIRSKHTGIWIVIMFVFITELFFYTWCRVQSVRVGYDTAKSVENRQSLLKLHKNLKIELARLKSPERLTQLAKQLQLKTPTQKQMIIIR